MSTIQMAENPQELSRDTVFDLLSNSRRRFVLNRLQKNRSEIELGELATELAAAENGVTPDELSAQQRKRTYVSLYQTHVPKLVEVDVVTYDSESGVIQPTDRLNEIAAYFQRERETVRWEPVYLAVAALGIGAFLAAYFLRAPVLEPFPVAFSVLFVFILLSVSHYMYVEAYGANGSEILIRGK